MNSGYFTCASGCRIVLWGIVEERMVPVWTWDSIEEARVFIEALGELIENASEYVDRGIPESILREFR